MAFITKTISREKLRLKEYDSDSVVVIDSDALDKITERKFYNPAIELLALIYSEEKANRYLQ